MNYTTSTPRDLAAQSFALPEQFDIMVAGKCNAKCSFCVQEATWKSPNAKADTFLTGLHEHFHRFYQLGGRRVVITGGEPTMFMNRVLGSLDILKEYEDLEVKAVYTNGSLLLSSYKGDTIAQAMKKQLLQDVNLSVHHHDDVINNEILHLPNKPSTESIVKHLVETGLKVRFNLTLQKGGVSSFTQFDEYVRAAFRMGAKDVYVRELFQFAFATPKSISERNAIQVSRQEHICSAEIIEQALKTGKYQQIREKKDEYRDKTEVKLQHLSSGKIVRIAKLSIGTESKNALPYLIYMPDGKLYKGWLGESDRLCSI